MTQQEKHPRAEQAAGPGPQLLLQARAYHGPAQKPALGWAPPNHPRKQGLTECTPEVQVEEG